MPPKELKGGCKASSNKFKICVSMIARSDSTPPSGPGRFGKGDLGRGWDWMSRAVQVLGHPRKV